MKLEKLTPKAVVGGLDPDGPATVVSVEWHGDGALTLTYRRASGGVAEEILTRRDEDRLRIVEQGRPWSFDGDGGLFRLVSEARRIELAHLFDPLLAVHTSEIEAYPHQITAVYESMLQRQPLRFLLADDPGAGKTIMAGLLIKELIARGDLERCLIVCPAGLAEQWRDELDRRFGLNFRILTNEGIESAAGGNWFLETDLSIARLDKLARNDDLKALLEAPDCRYDLVVADEAHKMSASFTGNEVKFTKRYRLGETLSRIARHFLLMSATPHNGKEEDFQLFLALLDADRFEGRFRDGVHRTDVSDLMRRMVKESLRKFDGTPLFPERVAYTVPYRPSQAEARLYEEVSTYVREEFNRAEALANGKRVRAVGFALTILQRRLASSTAAIHQSLRRRRERLEGRLRDLKPGARSPAPGLDSAGPELDEEEIEDVQDLPEEEAKRAEEHLYAATAAGTITELEAEIISLGRLELLAAGLRKTGEDTKWRQLADLLGRLFTTAVFPTGAEERPVSYGPIPPPGASPHHKLVVFTEHRDTLDDLKQRIATRLGRSEALVVIHGGLDRRKRRAAEEAFRHDLKARVLLATDAAGEGINLQCAHLMVNYDLPWNPNRLEQRFGRIHRIGQTEVCHLWNLLAEGTREGDVYRTLLEKLEQARQSLGGKVFNVLGKLQFGNRPLRELLIEAIRYGESQEVRERLFRAVADAVDRPRLEKLIKEEALTKEVMDAAGVARVREEMERAEARRLQPHYVEAFFLEAFRRLGGSVHPREPRRYEITHAPAVLGRRDLQRSRREPVLHRYERVAFEKTLLAPPGKPRAALLCPGHPLLDAAVALTLERDGGVLRRGAVLVDERDPGTGTRVLFTLEQAIRDGGGPSGGEPRTISRRLLHLEIGSSGEGKSLPHAPYLDYRPLAGDDPALDALLARLECRWVSDSLEEALGQAIARIVPEHADEVREQRLSLIGKTRAAVKARLTSEIQFWDRKAAVLKEQEASGKPGAALNSREARRRADELELRLASRMAVLDREERISVARPTVTAGALIVPAGLLAAMRGESPAPERATDTQVWAARARKAVMEVERSLGFEPTDREFDRLGYDIESRVPETGRLRFIEVKGRRAGAHSITVTKNEILTALNKPEDYILAIVEFVGADGDRVRYVRRPFRREPDFGVTSADYRLDDLLARSEPPS